MEHFNSTFGVEIECYLPEGESMQNAAMAVESRLGAPCRVEGLNKTTKTYWKVVPDGSLGVRGAEFVSPVLKGEAGLAQLDTVMQALSDFGCSVSRRCGMHVHVGVGAKDIAFYQKLVKLYASYEPVIDTLVPASRRASTNQFCHSLTRAEPGRVDRASTLDELMRVAMPGMPKYHKVNLLPSLRHNADDRTVEFRQHSGTLDGRKARMWIVLCLRMIATAQKPEFNIGSTGRSVNQARVGSKAHQIGEMFLRPEGVTGQDVCRAMGWPSVSMPAQARAAGIEFTTQRMGRQVRYFARSAQAAQTSAPITLAGLCQTVGSSDDELQFYTDRVRNLSGPIAWAA